MLATFGLVVALSVSPLPAHLEQEARRIEADVIGPCCWRQQVSIHQSPAADEIRKDIRIRLGRGETRQDILEDYAVQFGPRILAEPPASGYRRLLYVLPPVALVLSAAGIAVFLKRASARPSPATPGAASPLSAQVPASDVPASYGTKLEDELREMD